MNLKIQCYSLHHSRSITPLSLVPVAPVKGKHLCNLPHATEETKVVNQEMLKKLFPTNPKLKSIQPKNLQKKMKIKVDIIPITN